MLKYQEIKKGDLINGFVCVEVREIKEINNVAYIYEHQLTKAKCVHLFNDDKNNLFSIGFRTPVFDNTGVPHILEHSVLSGSKKYPLKDPFKELIKSSMHTFLNAMTYPDRTIYPISSQVPADFFNLTDVYLDAVFNPILSEYTFAQEGWHFDLADESSPAAIKGIVYNEMKGVFSDFNSFVERNLYGGLFPDTTYSWESGGKPDNITDLTYDNFKDFHSKFYHPSNSFIVLYGNIPSADTLFNIDNNYLKNFDYLKVNSEIVGQKDFTASKHLHIYAPSAEEDDGSATVLLAWNWRDKHGNESNIRELRILSNYLLSGENAPLKKALLDSGFGEDVDDLSGLETDLYSVSFTAGLKKTKPVLADKIVAVIKDTIKKEINKGFDKDAVEGILRQLEFKSREIGGEATYPLSFATRIYKFWIYGGDPVKYLQFEEEYARIRKNIAENPRYLENLLASLTINNKNEILMVCEASKKEGEKLGRMSDMQAKKLSEHFTAADRIKFSNFTKELGLYQQKNHSAEELSCIPLLKKSDIPAKNDIVPVEPSKIGDVKHLHSPLFTGGVFYLNLAFDICVIPDELLDYVSLYMEYLGRAGAGGLSGAEISKLWKLHSGGFSSFAMLTTDYEKRNSFVANNVFTVKMLEKDISASLDILSKVLFEADFTDTRLVKNVLNEEKNDMFDEIIAHGHSHAIIDAAARFSPANAIKYRTEGIGYYKFLKGLSKNCDEILEKLKQIHAIFINSQNLTVSTVSNITGFEKRLEDFIVKIPRFTKKTLLTPDIIMKNTKSVLAADEINGMEITSSVNYCSSVFEIDNNDTKNVGNMTLLSQILSKGYLWDKIRVAGGAYGGFSGYNSVSKIFSFGSFRDPNLEKTFAAFQNSLKQDRFSQEIIDRSIPSEIGALDSPKSPQTKGINELYAMFSGYDNDKKQEIRDAILSADENSVAAALDLLKDASKTAQRSVLGSKDSINSAKISGLVIKKDKL